MRRTDRVRVGRELSGVAAVVFALAMVLMQAAPASATHRGQHWARDGLTNSQVYFVDHTSSEWPIGTVVANWDQARAKRQARLNVYWVSSCPNTSVHCVHVRSYTNATAPFAACKSTATTKVYGCTAITTNSTSSHIVSAAVYVNASASTTAEQRKKSSCHEVGHALRLNHRASNTSCMTQGASPPISQFPDDHDYEALGNMYDGHAN